MMISSHTGERRMKLDDSRESDNVEDGRGGGGGIRGIHLGLLGTVVVIGVGYFLGISPSTMLSLLSGGGQTTTDSAAPVTPATDANDPQVVFVRKILASTEDVWGAYFQGMGKTYSAPKLHLFTDSVDSACGMASAASGPFYCPGDRKVYIDLSFYQQLATQFGAPGQFAQAYVIAHEVGHHVQNLLGITDKASRQEEAAGRLGGNHVSVEVELQADCFAGVWAQRANQASQILEPGDLEQGLTAASSVGDDTLQKRERGTVVPDSFTHGTSAQRVRWFKRGYDSGKIENCDTFSAGSAL
jgi:predicted metalloprotease